MKRVSGSFRGVFIWIGLAIFCLGMLGTFQLGVCAIDTQPNFSMFVRLVEVVTLIVGGILVCSALGFLITFLMKPVKGNMLSIIAV